MIESSRLTGTYIWIFFSGACSSTQFRCDNGRCIPAHWRCDSHMDCDDGSDEIGDCASNRNCRPGQFQCELTQKCLHIGWMCDGEPDCGTSPELGPDTSDEDPHQCQQGKLCSWNEARCGETLECRPLSLFCDGHGDCPDNSDEWDFCRNKTLCSNQQCEYKCKPTLTGPMCYCADGYRVKGTKCVDANECDIDGTCAQTCKNTVGSFTCSCVPGYVKNGTDCQAVNVPPTEEASLIYSTRTKIRRLSLNGTIWPGNSTLKLLTSNSLEFSHRNRSACYIHYNLTKTAIVCVSIDDMSQSWELGTPSNFPEVDSIQQMALDWVSGNWYFLDDVHEVILLCTSSLAWCNILLEHKLSKPRAIALDATKGYMFFTKWGHTAPMLERCKLDGLERTPLVVHKIVYPYGVAVDFPTSHVYWVDTYLDYVERIDYNGENRRTIMKGFPVQNLYGITVFESRLFVSSWHNDTIRELHKMKLTERQILKDEERPFNLHVFHRQRQPDVSHPCKTNNGGCQHFCIPYWLKSNPVAKCVCASGYTLLPTGNCTIEKPTTFLAVARSKPASIKGIPLQGGRDAMAPIMGLSQPMAIDFDIASDTIIYSDGKQSTIKLSKMNGTINSVSLNLIMERCEGLAFDWMAKNLYWTDETLGRISVVRMSNFKNKKILIQSHNMHPRSIVVHPKKGIMYWADWSHILPGNGSIQRSWMNGENQETFLQHEIDWPTGLTIDLVGKKLYWCDAHLKRIESVNFDGNNRNLVLSVGINRPFGLALHRKAIYFIEYVLGSVMAYFPENGTVVKIVDNNPPIFDIKIYDSKLQTGENACSQNNGNCTELCLSTPSKSVCACSDGYKLTNDGRSCTKDSTYVKPSICDDSFFKCKQSPLNASVCIPMERVCDGAADCPDASDESVEQGGPCENVVCNDSQHKCDGTMCIAKYWVCDGDKDCFDGSDEDPKLCTGQCNDRHFTCENSKRCIPQEWKCDSVVDCGPNDNSDEKYCTVAGCSIMEFKCNNSRCISINMYCNGIDDCKDGSDEMGCAICNPVTEFFCPASKACLPVSLRCDKKMDCGDGSDEFDCEEKNFHVCEPFEFKCKSLECIPKQFACDGRLDCIDGSDEQGCSITSIKNTTFNSVTTYGLECEHPSRMCDNNTVCITADQLCNNHEDCQDGSDEGLRCVEMLCEHSLVCSHTCHNAPEGLVCSCPPPLHLQQDQMRCLEAHPCEDWGTCSQICTPIRTRHKCSCLPGYTLTNDGFTCKSDDPGIPLVIFSNRHELRGVNLNNYNAKALISSLKNTIALDFYHSEDADMVFWTDVIDDKIYSGTVVGGSLSNIEVVVQTGLSTAEGLAVDWIGKNLYWVESNLDQIEVARLNGSFRRTLVAGDMESPRAIALDPRDGLLFWSDWDNMAPRIERCSLAGLDRTVVVRVDHVTDGAWPNGITLDYDARRIYWIDARSDSIHAAKYDGTDHHEIMRNHEMLSHPFAITLYENYIYWTDWRTNSVVRANKWTGGDVSVIQRTLTQPFDIQILHASRQPHDGSNPCGENNGGCSHLCLLHTNKTYRCDCPHVMKLDVDNRTCVVNERVLLIARSNEIRGVDLVQPYYHTIPTISSPQVLNPSQLEFLGKNNTLYWSDSQVSEVKRSGLTTGPTETLIDTGIQRPSGLAVDWLSNNIFIGSPAGISACNLDGEYCTAIVEDVEIISLVADPARGKLYWIAVFEGNASIETSAMDASDRTVIVANLSTNSKSLSIDLPTNRLYWVSDYEVYYASLEGGDVSKLQLPAQVSIAAAVVYQDYVYYADDDDQSIHKANKSSGNGDVILRNGTGSVLALRIYDPDLQKGNHPCGINKGGCAHLCLAVNETSYTCQCASGYVSDPDNPALCNSVPTYLIYSLTWEIRGLSLDGDNSTRVLGPISRVSMASAIDFVADQELILWTDSDHGIITSIKTDSTHRKVVVEQIEGRESVPVDWLNGLAVDWVAKNIYWCDPKRDVIEVSRLNGSARYVVVSENIGKLASLVIDPIAGVLVWGGASHIEKSGLDGSNRRLLYNQSLVISDLGLDLENRQIYWTDSEANSIERINYDGSDHVVLLNQSLENPVALTIFNNSIYWLDSTHDRGSIKVAPLNNLSDYETLLRQGGDSLRDIQIFSKLKQVGTNPCAFNNGGCQQLCLFNGTDPVCACPHGILANDDKTCKDYDSFIMYSRVVSIDSIHMTNATIHNSPYPSIKNESFMRNAIGLTFDYNQRRLYYSDIQRGSINTVHFNGSGHAVLVARQGSVEGLAFEQLYKALYWTCNNDASINRINLTNYGSNASEVEAIVKLRPQDKPRGIAVDSCGGQVFWSNWNSHQPSIERAFLTGYGHEVIINTEIRMPNAMTLDHQAHKIYWGDARLDKIERCEYDGSGRVVLAKLTPQHPFALAVYGDFIFWTDWVLHAVLRVDKLTGQNVVWLRQDISKPMGIIAVANNTDDCFSNPCLSLNGGCEEICSLTPEATVQCACLEGRILADDGRRCFSKLSSCTDESFRCSDGGCVPFQVTCDGIVHCSDGSDEEPGYCGHRSCPLAWFQCLNKRCVLSNLTCNGVDDCGDFTDELNCSCSDKNHFRCTSGECIPRNFRCDRDPDCRDVSDEMGCEIRNCSREMRDMNFVNCPNTTACVHREWFCDGENDCWDKSDEQNCRSTELNKCNFNEFQCLNGNCIKLEARCDGRNDCKDGNKDGVSSDERNCKGRCRVNELMCKSDGSCISSLLHCNGQPDCPDGSDELDCKQCRSDQFRCTTGECIPISWQCDGQPDCADQTDETEHCRLRECGTWEYLCNSTGRCIPWGWVCDGEADCQDMADEHEEQGCKASSCLSDYFQCADRTCISTLFYCDGDFDCADKSDEPPLCQPHCLDGEFRCDNGKCVMEMMKCDGHDDCGDGSDESKVCKDNTSYCTGDGWFTCNNGVCLNDSLLCNGEDNCGDFSDENKCNINECSSAKPPCAHKCVDKPVGYECRCNDGFKLSTKDNHLCEDINECDSYPCSQKCRNTRGSFHCSCVDGYVLHSDRKSCRANSTIPAKLILANRYYIREVDLDGHSTLVAHNLTNAVALDYEWKSQCIFWSDVTAFGSSIKRLCNNTVNSIVEDLHSATLQNPDGLAVDWIAHNLYWCDKGLDTLEVSSLDGKYRKILINGGLDEPRAVAVDPLRGYLYWSDWGTQVHIGKAGLDGSNQQVIINSSLGWPNALSVAYDTNELFWADAREDYIAVSDLDGNNIRIVASRSKSPQVQLHHVFALSIWEDFVYWTDWETKSIERCHKYHGDQCSSLFFTVHRPMDIKLIHPFRQPEKANPCENANCSALCLLNPEPPFYTCACPENYILGTDGRGCISNCSSAHFECKSTYKCIPFWWKCDTQNDCGDGSDEPEDCPPFKCKPGQFQCKNGHCIHPSELCNGHNDCSDNSDEMDCQHYTCLNNQFRCPGNESVTARCIPSSQRCDRNKDCPLGEDEFKCPPATCPPNQYKCNNDKCIPTVWVCDNDNDCGDESDELQDCGKRSCPLDHFRCSSGRCIPMSWQCDGDPDCSDGEDEPPTCSQPEYHACEPTYFKCANNKCIPGRWHCDYDNDCGDGSDELGCLPRNCSESEFRCEDGRCIHGSFQCDGEYQCDDKSDEMKCHSKCKNNEFQCTHPQFCIFLQWKCDGDTDCADGSDEVNCSDTCPDNGFKCNNGLCINEDWRCDGQNDCEDGSDESLALCVTLACPPGRLRCRNHRCVPISAVCDGRDQCGDNSDEDPLACRSFGKCAAHQYRCRSGHCIDAQLQCDGENDCEDNSDEEDCNNSVCRWGTCSQTCVVRKHGNYTCKCNAGYHHTRDGGCQAQGAPAQLVLAAEAELRLMSPYKASIANQIYSKTVLATAPGYKVDAVDIFYDLRQVTAFWCDHLNKRVQSMTLPLNDGRRVTRETDIRTVLSALREPRGLAVDWVGRKLYVSDLNRIIVATLDGHLTYTLIDDEMQQPRDIVVAPAQGLLFWTDWGPLPRIETAYMDGNRRHVLVTAGVLWPTGLALDHAAQRIYWADPKALTIESVRLDGGDRHVVKVFTQEERPYKLEVFEDNLFVSTYHTHNVLRLDKFGRGNISHLAQGLPRLSHILIVQEHRQERLIANRCQDFCHTSEFCLLAPGGATCTCADGFVKDNLTCQAVSTSATACSLNCNTGSCKIIPGQGPKCICPPKYAGVHCEQYRCSQFCRNKGMCYIDLLSPKTPDTPPPLGCNCPPQWTGERCEIPVNMCENYCYNGGTCFNPRPDQLHCNCPPGFTGARCQDCAHLECKNGGVCTRTENFSNCHCPIGYFGQSCEKSDCDHYCVNSGSCKLTPTGPWCTCQPGFVGLRCEQNACFQHCQNGGTCRIGTKQLECVCPPLYSGRRCEINQCLLPNPLPDCRNHCGCQNNGTCEVRADMEVCKCTSLWGGSKCEIYLGHDNPCMGRCHNDGICKVGGPRHLPICICTEGWTGEFCEQPAACQFYCEHGGDCTVVDGMPTCHCTSEYKGMRCTELISRETYVGEIAVEGGNAVLSTLLAVGSFVLVVCALGAIYFILRRRHPFAHERLQENDFNNPIYQERDAEPFTLDADKSGNFANPVYETVYNGCGSVKEEKAGLLQNTVEEPPPPLNEET
ncbi:hypothetical protein PPYR_00751 [Photinus pyralis]|uniref:Low-density lipoprotein receptor-related protein 2 n=1 Tax=Photinus pyralis TaxID=7054 RepID=A0A5N4B2E4_PHOPY|nr:hypothetical protein PPYR_00751 [Photinus pyralis]